MQTLKMLKLSDLLLVTSPDDATHNARQYDTSYSLVDAVSKSLEIDGYKARTPMQGVSSVGGVRRNAMFLNTLSAVDKALNSQIDPKGEFVQILQGNCRTRAARKFFERNPARFAEVFPDGIPVLVHDELTVKEAVFLIVDDTKDPLRKHLGRSEKYDAFVRLIKLGCTQAEIETHLGEARNTEAAVKSAAGKKGDVQQSRTQVQMFERLRVVSAVIPEIERYQKEYWNVNDGRIVVTKETAFSFNYFDREVLMMDVAALKAPLTVGGDKRVVVNADIFKAEQLKKFSSAEPLSIVNADINALYFSYYRQDKAEMNGGLTTETAVWLTAGWNELKRKAAHGQSDKGEKNARTKSVIKDAASKLLAESGVKDALRWSIVEGDFNIETLGHISASERAFCRAYIEEFEAFCKAGNKRVSVVPVPVVPVPVVSKGNDKWHSTSGKR